MQKFKQLIGQAFARIDAANPQMRQKVYENIWLIQEKALAQRNIDEAQKQRWRSRLTELLKETENQYRRAAAPAAPPPAAPHPAGPAEPFFAKADNAPPPRQAAKADFAADRDVFFPENDNPQPRRRPAAASIDRAPAERPLPAGAPALDAPIELTPSARPNNAETAKTAGPAKQPRLDALEAEVNREVKPDFAETRSFWQRIKLSSYIIGALSILVALFVVWSFYNSFGGAAPAKRAQFTGPMHQNNYGMNGWTEVFNPGNINGLPATAGAAAVNLHNEPDAQFIRITSQNPDKDAVILDVGQGALLGLRGKTATFKLVARNVENNMGQLSLAADFGNGQPRQRYDFELPPTAKQLLFRLDIPQNLKNGVRFYLSGGKADGKPHEIDVFSLLLRGTADNAP